MRLFFGCLLLTLFFSNSAIGQKIWKRHFITPEPVVCYASGEVEKSFIPPPEQVMNRLKSAAEKKCEIIVTYSSFPDSVKSAFEYAVSIWEQLIESDVPIYISALWKTMGLNTLGSCAPSAYYRNYDEFYYSDRFYPVAVAEKLIGEHITDSSSPDMTASFNKNIEWYYGTDGNTPTDKYDFVSTILHELAHGLGFIGFFYVDNGSGGYDKPPAVFDQYITNSLKQNLINTQLFINPSDKIYKAITSNLLYFRSPASLFNNDGNPPRLYAPSVWSDGSSVYHLNDATYGAGSKNSLMTHASGLGEAIHDPGPITMGILADIGWKNMVIKHDTLKDIETVVAPVLIEASIVSDYTLDSTSLYVFYSTDSFNSVDSVLLIADEKSTYFKAELPIRISSGIISYYISATDEKQRTFTKPAGAPQKFFKLRIGPDTINPTIVHQPKGYLLDKSPNLNITAYVDDNIGIDTVWIEYFLNDQSVASQGLKNDSASVYSTVINLSNWDLKENDSISYRIVARDISLNQNISYLPAKGNFVVKIKEFMAPVTKYANTFNESNTDFISSDFEIKTVSGFIDGALHGAHPYASPAQDNMFYNFTTLLNYPVILAENSQMDYDEIVLVEPGEPGSVFGEVDFYDFVIVEGSKDYGDTWLPLVDGYDSRNNLNWEVEYNNGINTSGNSTTVGKKEMFIKKNINILENGNFAIGDTIFIRFRLFSDPYANGWGWVIDNLRIQMLTSANHIKTVSPGDFRIYPNPFNDLVTVEFISETRFENISMAVYDSYGRLILNEPVQNKNSGGFRQELNLKPYPSGMYYIQVFADGQRILSRKLIKQK